MKKSKVVEFFFVFWGILAIAGFSAYITTTSKADQPPAQTAQITEIVEQESGQQLTKGQENALKAATNYLAYSAFSRSGLVKQLEYEGYTNEEATFAVDNCGADWFQQAVQKAGQYLQNSAFSRSKLIEQLEYEGFTKNEAEYAVSEAYK